MITTSPASIANGKRVILVEDDRDFRESIVEYLELSGLDVTGVESALEFYKNITLHNYQLAILDISLPDQNGIVLAEYIRHNTDMRIVMLTAQSSIESRIAAYRNGADIYMVKPVDFAELSASIFSILGRLDDHSPLAGELKQDKTVVEEAQKQWKLVLNDWILYSPKGDEIKLTSKEFDFIHVLAMCQNRVALRTELLKALDYENNDFGNRALVALVNRLRRKYEQLNYKSPVKTVHGSGYCFSASIIIV
jgi:DNA-binding response OmpR family regulator